MAYIVGKLVENQASGGFYTPNFSNIIWDTRLSAANRAILADDLILTGIANRQTVGTTLNAATGYTALGTYGRNGNQASRLFYKKATGGETGVAYTVENSDCIGITWIIRGCDTTTTIAVGTRKDSTNAGSVTPSGGELPTALAEDLVIHAYSAASTATPCHARLKINEATIGSRYDSTATGNLGFVMAYKQQESAGTVSAATWYNRTATNGGNSWIISIKSATGAAFQPDVRTNINELNWYGLHGSVNTLVPTTNAWTRPSLFASGAAINGINLSTIALGAVTTSTQPFGTTIGTFSGIPHATLETAWAGAFHAIASTDMRGMLFSIQWALDFNSAVQASTGSEGVICVFSDGTNYVAYQIAKKAKGWGQTVPQTAIIALGAGTAYASSGTVSTVLSAVTQVGYFWHRTTANANSLSILVRNALLISTRSATTPAYGAHLTGGGSVFPATPGDFHTAILAAELQAISSRQAEGQIMTNIDMVFGDGTNKTYVDASAVPVTFPQEWTATDSGNWQMGWNVPTLTLNYGIKTSANDTINLTADSFVAPNKQLMVIDSGANTGATVSIAGSSIVGTTFTDNAGFALTSGTFKNGGTVSLKASATSLSVSNTFGAVPAVAMTANNKTIASSTIDLTGTSATYHLTLPATVTALTLNTVTLSGTPNNAGADKIYSELASGTLTITTDGLGTALVAGDVEFVGGSTAVAVIASPQVYQTVTVSGFTAGSRIQIYDTTSSTELFNGTASSGNTVVSGTTATWTDPAAASADRAIRIRVSYVNGATAKNFIESSGLTCGQTSGTKSVTYPVTPTADTTYNSNGIDGPAIYATSGITFTDAATDLVNCNIAGGAVTYKTIYACFVYWSFTSTGIANDFTYIDAPDTANYILSGMKIRNTSAVDLSVTGGYGRDATTGASVDIIDTAGSTGNIFLAPDHVVAYATGSGVTSQDISDIAAASAISTTTAVLASAVDGTVTLAESIRLHNSVLGGKVSGAGTGTETFRDLADTKNRLVATVDADGNRTVVTRTLT